MYRLEVNENGDTKESNIAMNSIKGNRTMKVFCRNDIVLKSPKTDSDALNFETNHQTGFASASHIHPVLGHYAPHKYFDSKYSPLNYISFKE